MNKKHKGRLKMIVTEDKIFLFEIKYPKLIPENEPLVFTIIDINGNSANRNRTITVDDGFMDHDGSIKEQAIHIIESYGMKVTKYTRGTEDTDYITAIKVGEINE